MWCLVNIMCVCRVWQQNKILLLTAQSVCVCVRVHILIQEHLRTKLEWG